MSETGSGLQAKLAAGKKVVLAELWAPAAEDQSGMEAAFRSYRDNVDAVGVSDNRDTITIAALAAACLAQAQGLEPIMHITTRDRNRIALVSEVMGARALGIRNLLVTGGTHQTLGSFSGAKSVYDVDTVQLLGMIGSPACSGCFAGGVVDPFADPAALQLLQTGKKIRAGARFLITKPVFDFEAFRVWWDAMLRQGMPDQAAVIAGIHILGDADEAAVLAKSRPDPRIPAGILERMAGCSKARQKEEGKKIALETLAQLLRLDKIKGVAIGGNPDRATLLEVIAAARKAGA